MECIVENIDITDLQTKLTKLSLYASERNKRLKTLTKDYNLLKKNIATLIGKKDKDGVEISEVLERLIQYDGHQTITKS